MGFLETRAEFPARILESPVAVEQRMCVRLKSNSFIKGVHHQQIVIMVIDLKSHNSTVIQVEDSAQIDFVDFCAGVVLKLGYVCQPLLIRCLGVKFSMQIVLCNVIWIAGTPSAALWPVLYTRMNLQFSVDIQNSFVVDVDIIVYGKLIADSAVSHIRMFVVNFPDFFGDFLVFKLVSALRMFQPFVIGRTRDVQIST
jgi:hypothetical protein